MVDKIQKALSRFTKKDKERIQSIVLDIKNTNIETYNVKKLRGYKDIFRIRKGKIRIIYRAQDNKKIKLIIIEKRSDNTYKF